MSDIEVGPPTLLTDASRWLNTRRMEKPSPNSELARRADLAVVAGYLADQLRRALPAGVPPDAPPFERQLSRLSAAELRTDALIDAFAAHAADGHAASSVRRALSTWRGFCRWLVTTGRLDANPLDGVNGPRRPAWVPKALDLAELERVIVAASTPDPRARHPWPARDRALVAVFVGAGLRIGEAITMKVGSVEAADHAPRVRVVGKGSKVRVVPVGPEVVEVVAAYLDERLAVAGRFTSTDPLFVRRVGADYVPFNRQAMDHLVLGWYRRAAVAPPPGSLAHALRHSYATALVDHGASLPEVQQLLGHADLSTTQVYLKVSARGLEQTALANPARAFLRAARPPSTSARAATEAGAPQ